MSEENDLVEKYYSLPEDQREGFFWEQSDEGQGKIKEEINKRAYAKKEVNFRPLIKFLGILVILMIVAGLLLNMGKLANGTVQNNQAPPSCKKGIGQNIDVGHGNKITILQDKKNLCSFTITFKEEGVPEVQKKVETAAKTSVSFPTHLSTSDGILTLWIIIDPQAKDFRGYDCSHSFFEYLYNNQEMALPPC